MKFLLDTDHVSVIQGRTEPKFSAISARRAACSDSDIVSSIVTLHEQFLGRQAYLNRGRGPGDAVIGYGKLAEMMEFYKKEEVPLLPFDDAAAAEFARLRADGVRIGTMDRTCGSLRSHSPAGWCW
jgi:tRNA(fMet)-specific endonuclease VapC